MFSSLVNENCDLYIWLILYIFFQLMSLVGFYTPRKRSFGGIKWSLFSSVGSFVRPSVPPNL